MRRTKRYVVPGVRAEALGQRDNGKTFILTEMDAYSGQEWALKAATLLGASGADIPQAVADSGMAALIGVGLRAFLGAPTDARQALLDELLRCAQYEHNPKIPPQPIERGPNCCIEEINTFFALYGELIDLHTGFSLAAAFPTTATASPTMPTDSSGT